MTALGRVLLPLLTAGCLDPTQITLEVETDLDCPSPAGDLPTVQLRETGFRASSPQDLVTIDLSATTGACMVGAPLNRIGSLALSPSDDKDAAIGIEVVGTVQPPVSNCRLPEYQSQCVVARRVLRFQENRNLPLPIKLRKVCLGVVCEDFETCVGGTCVSSDFDPDVCEGEECDRPTIPVVSWEDTSPGEPGDVLQLTGGSGSSLEPALLRQGSEHVLVWTDDRTGGYQVFFNRLDEVGGVQLDSQAVVSDAMIRWRPAIAERPGGYWLAMDRQGPQGGSAVVLPLDANGVVDAGVSPAVMAGERNPALDAVGNLAALATVLGGGIRGRIAGSGGFFETADVDVSPESVDAAEPSVAVGADGVAFAWRDARDGNAEIYVSVIPNGSSLVEPAVRITDASGTSTEPSIVGAGDGYGLAWSDERDGGREIYFALLDEHGQLVGDELRVTEATGVSDQPTLVWIGLSYGLAWRDRRGGNDQIFFVRISAAGVPKQALQITETTGRSLEPSLDWTGDRFGLAWEDDSAGGWDLYFAPITP